MAENIKQLSNAFSLGGGLNINSNQPIDSRFKVQSLVELTYDWKNKNNGGEISKYEGLLTFVEAEGKTFRYRTGATYTSGETTISNWELVPVSADDINSLVEIPEVDIQSISVNGETVAPVDGNVNIIIPGVVHPEYELVAGDTNSVKLLKDGEAAGEVSISLTADVVTTTEENTEKVTALSLATEQNIGKIILVKTAEGDYLAGTYIIDGIGSVKYLATTTGTVDDGDVDAKINSAIDSLDSSITAESGFLTGVTIENGKLVSYTSATVPEAPTYTAGDNISIEDNVISALGYTYNAEKNSFSTGTSVASGYGSHSEGQNTTASGTSSHAEGESTTASSNSSHAEGLGTIASGYASHSEGQNTIASGDYSHAEGYSTTALGYLSHTEGSGGTSTLTGYNWELNSQSIYFTSNPNINIGSVLKIENNEETLFVKVIDISEDKLTISVDKAISLEFNENSILYSVNGIAYGDYSHAEGNYTQANGSYSHSEGGYTTAAEQFSHAEGGFTTASGDSSHAEGNHTIASGYYSHAEGFQTNASGVSSHAECDNTIASGFGSHAEGNRTIASGDSSHAEGRETIASGLGSHAEGSNTTALGEYSHAEGSGSTSTLTGYNWELNSKSIVFTSNPSLKTGYILKIENNGENLFVLVTAINEDNFTATVDKSISLECDNSSLLVVKGVALGESSHTEGWGNTTSGWASHAEGSSNIASGQSSHAEGDATIASNWCSHAEGYATKAEGSYSHAEGIYTITYSNGSHAEGYYTTAKNEAEHAEGHYNVSHKNSNTYGDAGNTTHSIGIGTSEEARKNAQEVMQNGDFYVINVGGYDGTNINAEGVKTLQGVIEGITSDLSDLGDYKVKDVNDADKILAVDTNGDLSSTISIAHVKSEDGTKNEIVLRGIGGVQIGDAIDASEFVVDGFLDSVSYDSTTHELVFVFNEYHEGVAGQQEVRVDLTTYIDNHTFNVVDGSWTSITITPTVSEDGTETVFNLTINDSALTTKLESMEGEIADNSEQIGDVLSMVEAIKQCTSGTISAATSDAGEGEVSVVSNAQVDLSGDGSSLTGSFTAVNVVTKQYVTGIETALDERITELENAVDDDTKCESATINAGTTTELTEGEVAVLSNTAITLSGDGTSLTGTATAVKVVTKKYVDSKFESITDSDTKCTSATINVAEATTPETDEVDVISKQDITLTGDGTSLETEQPIASVKVVTKQYVDSKFAEVPTYTAITNDEIDALFV